MIRSAAIIAALALVGVASAAVGSVALFAVALGSAVLVVVLAAALLLGARRAQVVRTIDRHEVLEQHPVTVRFRVAGLRGLPVRVELREPGGRWRVIDPAGDELQVALDRPGAHMLAPSAMRVRDDLGLMTRRLRGGEPQALLVLPRPEPPPALAAGGGALQAGDIEPDGLRPYVPGTSMGRIHWPSAARGAELQERHFVPARDRLPLVVVDLTGAPKPEAVDWVARTAAGYVLAAVRAGGCRIALPGDRAPSVIVERTIDWPLLHRRLATLDDLAASHTPAFRPGDADHDAITVQAAAAPAAALHPRAELPPWLVPLAEWEARA